MSRESRSRRQDGEANGTPIRVFHLIKGLGRGGAEVLLSEGLQYANRERFDYRYGFFLPWKDQLVEALERQGAEVTCFGVRHPVLYPRGVFQVARHLRRWKTDLLHCHLPMTGVVGRLAGRLAGVPVVYTEHNVMERYHPLTRRANRWTWGSQDLVIAVSDDVAASIGRNVNGNVPVRRVLNGVDTEAFQRDEEARERVRATLGIPSSAPVLGTVAVFRPQKRLDLWLEIARQVLEREPDLHCLLVGDGPMRSAIEEQAHRLGIVRRVHFAGLQREVLPHFSAIDVFLMSSRFEGFPLALLEAMSAELPVVATRVGGIPEAVVDGGTGYLVAEDSPAEAAEAVLCLLADAERRREFGRTGRRRVEERFSMARMTAELERVYLEVLGRAADG